MSTPTDIRVLKRDGSLTPYDGAEVATSIADAARGLDDAVTQAVQLRSEVEITLFDGISTSQLDEAVIQVALGNVKDDPAFDTIAARLLTKHLYKQVFGDTHDLFGDEPRDGARAARRTLPRLHRARRRKRTPRHPARRDVRP